MQELKKIDHIGIAVADLDQAIATYQKLLGVAPFKTEDVPDQKVTTAFFDVGGPHVELLEATDPSSPIATFIQKRGGKGGIHHICFEVNDIHAKLKELKDSGIQLIHEEPFVGAGGKLVAFVHPKGLDGVLVELSQRS